MSARRQHITVGFRFKYHTSNQTAELASYKHECHICLILHGTRFSFFSFTNSLWTNVGLSLSMYGFRLSSLQASPIVGAVFHSPVLFPLVLWGHWGDGAFPWVKSDPITNSPQGHRETNYFPLWFLQQLTMLSRPELAWCLCIWTVGKKPEHRYREHAVENFLVMRQ